MTSETTRPSEHYTQHHDVEPPRVDAKAFRQGWRVKTRLDALLADQRITAATWQAACEYRTAWTATLRSATSTIVPHMPSIRDYHRSMLNRLGAATRIRETIKAIGDLAEMLAFRCAVEDQSWAATARQLGVNPETARDWTATALTALAKAWNRAPQ